MKSKLSATILKSLSIRVLVVILISSILSYIHLYNTIEKGSIETLSKYVHERGKREDALLMLAHSNHQVLKDEAEKRFSAALTREEELRFDKFLRRYPDGTIRNKKEIYDGRSAAGVFIPANVVMTSVLKHRVMVMMDLVESFGKAFRSRFEDTYFTTSDNIMVLYWPEVPDWTMGMKADFDMRKEEYVWRADKKHNAQRESVWTGVYYDVVSKNWMSSLLTPIDIGDWSATIGHDVMLGELIARVSSEHLEGTYNIIFNADGKLIAHPKFLSMLKDNGGSIDIRQLKDPLLDDIYHNVIKSNLKSDDVPLVTKTTDGENFISGTVLRGSNWFFVTVFPQTIISNMALNGIMFIIILALISLAFEIYIFYKGLEKDILQPLQKLEASVTRITQGEYDTRADINRADEIGDLAKSFNLMAEQIGDHEKSLLDKVEERTKLVDEQRAELVSKSKLASLGEMAGGIAHEINTPLSIISLKVDQLLDKAEEKKLDEEELIRSLETIRKTNDRIAKIISGLRFFARDGSGMPMVETSLDSIIDDTCSLCTEKLKFNGIKFVVIKEFSAGLTVKCRAVEISQVLINLLNNAVDAMAEIPLSSDRMIEFKILEKDHFIEMSVTDSGAGIKKEILEKIMQPFFTTKEVGKGTGLGLSISMGIMKTHHGRLYVDESSVRTRFVIELPKII